MKSLDKIRNAYYNKHIAYLVKRIEHSGGEIIAISHIMELQEAKKMLGFLRAIGNEDQRIAYAILEGMQLQRRLDAQQKETQNNNTQIKSVMPRATA